jgi:hypothetical protein
MIQRLLNGGQHTFGLFRRPTAIAAYRPLLLNYAFSVGCRCYRLSEMCMRISDKVAKELEADLSGTS